MSNQRIAILRTCASCEWIFKAKGKDYDCPMCGFVSYGARFVYENDCYKFAKTQKPWFDKKMDKYAVKLLSTIRLSNPFGTDLYQRAVKPRLSGRGCKAPSR